MQLGRHYRTRMRSLDSVTEAGRIRLLRPLAEGALTELPIEPRRLRLIGGFTNVLFRVGTAQGPCALRVELQQHHSDDDVDVELAWLASLAHDTDLDVLFEWVRGRILGVGTFPTGVGVRSAPTAPVEVCSTVTRGPGFVSADDPSLLRRRLGMEDRHLERGVARTPDQ